MIHSMFTTCYPMVKNGSPHLPVDICHHGTGPSSPSLLPGNRSQHGTSPSEMGRKRENRSMGSHGGISDFTDISLMNVVI